MATLTVALKCLWTRRRYEGSKTITIIREIKETRREGYECSGVVVASRVLCACTSICTCAGAMNLRYSSVQWTQRQPVLVNQRASNVPLTCGRGFFFFFFFQTSQHLHRIFLWRFEGRKCHFSQISNVNISYEPLDGSFFNY